MVQMHRQGDLLFVQQNDQPTRTDGTGPGGSILKSSLTGHDHKLTKGVVIPNRQGQVIATLEIAEEAEIVHEEHKPIKLSPGKWQVRRQREVRGFVED